MQENGNHGFLFGSTHNSLLLEAKLGAQVLQALSDSDLLLIELLLPATIEEQAEFQNKTIRTAQLRPPLRPDLAVRLDEHFQNIYGPCRRSEWP